MKLDILHECLNQLLFDIGVEGQTNKIFSFRILEPQICDSVPFAFYLVASKWWIP